MRKVFTIIGIAISSTLMSQVTILEENFDGSALDSGWKVVNNDGFTPQEVVEEYTEAWIIVEDPLNVGNGTVSSTSYFTPVNRADRWLITPQMTLGTENNYISWKGLSYDPSFPDSYKVLISTTGNEIADFTDTIKVVSNEYYTWTNHLEELDEYAGQDIYIAFVNTTFNGFKLYLDSIYVREQDPLSLQKEEIHLAIYPNPVRDFLVVNSNDAQIQGVTIINAMGQILLTESFNNGSGKVKVNTSSFMSGVYFITVETSKGIVRQKLIK